MKEHVPIREPKMCIETDCNRPAKKRERCLKHYQRLRNQELKTGTWEPMPSGNFGDPEGHCISAKMGGEKRAEDREGLREAGKIGGRSFAQKYPDAYRDLGKLGGKKVWEDREHMLEVARKGRESRWKKNQKEDADGEADL